MHVRSATRYFLVIIDQGMAPFGRPPPPRVVGQHRYQAVSAGTRLRKSHWVRGRWLIEAVN